MAKINVTKELSVDAEALWNLVRDFGTTPWIPGGDDSEVKGEGPGMIRIFQGPNGSVHERLESVDEASRTLVYTIPEGIPFPVTGYRSTMECKGSTLSWTCEFEPAGASEAEAGGGIEQMYGVMMGWITDHLNK